MDFSALIPQFEACGCTVTEYVPLSALTTFKIGGPARLLVDVPLTAIPALSEILNACQKQGIPTVWMGRGSNLLCADEGLDAVVLRMEADTAVNVEDDRLLSCSAGVTLTALCRAAQKHGLTGLEFAFGIPGSVGGAVYMNAGAYDGEIKTVLESVDVLTKDGKIKHLTAPLLDLSYRHSRFMETGEIVLTATFKLKPGDPEAITAKMNELTARRREKQPLEYPSAGSFFKRPTGFFAGKLVEDCGLKGFRVGDAQVSEKHAGFVINRGNATCADVKALAKAVHDKVLAETGAELRPEVRLIGTDWGF